MAQDNPDLAVKLAYVYRIAHFATLPENSGAAKPDNFVLCVVGYALDAPLREALIGKRVNDRPLTLRSPNAPEDVKGCDALFVGGGAFNAEQRARLVQNCRGLTVGENHGFLDHGGIVSLVRAGSNLRFELNLAAAKASNIRLSSKLVELAVRVVQ